MFFEKAHEGRNGWWRWLATIVITLAVMVLANMPLFVFLGTEAKQFDLASPPPGIDRNLLFALFLIPFVAGFFVLWLCIRMLHAKPFLSVITGRPRFDWRRAAIAFAVWFVLLGAGSFAFLPAGSYTFQFDAAAFWPLLLIALALVPIQGAFEEIFFRGYLMQGLSLLARNKIVPLIVVTALFTLVHAGNPEFSADQLRIGLSYLAVATLFGLIAVIDDGLEAPCGVHAANNIFGAVVLRPDVNSTFFTDSLFTAPFAALLKLSPYLDVATAVLAFCIFSYVFGWRLSKLIEPIKPSETVSAAPAGIRP
jgi:membrane protease YdiL (CAAX protease family)